MSTALAVGRHERPATHIDVARSEWTKLRTQPATLWGLASAAVLLPAVGILYSLLRVARPPKRTADIASFDAVSVSLVGLQLAQIAIGVLGVLLITNEYATGLIQNTFIAVPRRLPVLWGKAAALVAVAVAVSVPALLAAFLVGQSILARQHLGASLDDPGVVRALVGGVLYLGVAGLVGLALGALLRSTAGAVSALLALMFAAPILAGFLPGGWSDAVEKYTPTTAGLAVTAIHPDPATSLSPWTGFAVFGVYAVALFAFGAVRMERGDA